MNSTVKLALCKNENVEFGKDSYPNSSFFFSISEEMLTHFRKVHFCDNLKLKLL